MSATAVRPIAGSPYGPPPDRSLEQRREALVNANATRSRRAVLKRDMKAGRVSVLDLIEDPPDYILTMKLLDLLLAAPTVGRVKALSLLKRCDISPVKTLGGLTYRQRDELTAAWIWRRR
jgi:hypothetical protein